MKLYNCKYLITLIRFLKFCFLFLFLFLPKEHVLSQSISNIYKNNYSLQIPCKTFDMVVEVYIFVHLNLFNYFHSESFQLKEDYAKLKSSTS